MSHELLIYGTAGGIETVSAFTEWRGVELRCSCGRWSDVRRTWRSDNKTPQPLRVAELAERFQEHLTDLLDNAGASGQTPPMSESDTAERRRVLEQGPGWSTVGPEGHLGGVGGIHLVVGGGAGGVGGQQYGSGAGGATTTSTVRVVNDPPVQVDDGRRPIFIPKIHEHNSSRVTAFFIQQEAQAYAPGDVLEYRFFREIEGKPERKAVKCLRELLEVADADRDDIAEMVELLRGWL